MKSFREKSPDLEVNEETLMGSGGTDGFKQRKAAIERKKNDREIRKEELLRARIAEREERLHLQGSKDICSRRLPCAESYEMQNINEGALFR